jgi:P27 family predicted phage terminase small subunit
MTRRGPQPKHPDKRQRRNAPTAVLTVIDGGGMAAPAPMEGWQPQTIEKWDMFWSSDVAHAVQSSDYPALERLFRLYDLEHRLHEAGAKQPIVVGSQGQPVANPALKQADALRSEIRQLEDRFGLNPSARARLGLDTSKLQASLESLTQRVVDDEQAVDPRADFLAAEAD